MLGLLVALGVVAPPPACVAPSSHPSGATSFAYGRCLMASGPGYDAVAVRRAFTDAYAQHYLASACPLGDMLSQGLGGVQDPIKGLAICHDAAMSGDRESQAQYGGHALHGDGMVRDPVLARNLLTKAAQQGHALAALTLGMVYWNGDGIAKDNGEARLWWSKAYALGQKEAAFLLGEEAFVRLTSGVETPDKADPKVLDEAVGWYNKAQGEDPDPGRRALAGQRLAMAASVRDIVGKPLPPR